MHNYKVILRLDFFFFFTQTEKFCITTQARELTFFQDAVKKPQQQTQIKRLGGLQDDNDETGFHFRVCRCVRVKTYNIMSHVVLNCESTKHIGDNLSFIVALMVLSLISLLSVVVVSLVLL